MSEREIRVVEVTGAQYNKKAVVLSDCIVAILPAGSHSSRVLLSSGHEIDVDGSVNQLAAELLGLGVKS